MNYYIQFDFGFINSSYNAFSMTLASVQYGEGYQLYGSNNAGELGTLLYSSKFDPDEYCLGTFTNLRGTQFRYFSITASNPGCDAVSVCKPDANVIIQSITFMSYLITSETVVPTIQFRDVN